MPVDRASTYVHVGLPDGADECIRGSELKVKPGLGYFRRSIDR